MNNIEGIDARPLLTRRMAWDMLPHYLSPVVLRRMDLVPPGDEGEDMEHEDSHRRLDPLLEIEPYLRPILPVVKAVICAAMLVESDAECISPTPLTEEVVSEIVRASCVGLLAHLVSQEVVQVNDGYIGR
jgi:hypothetical protein